MTSRLEEEDDDNDWCWDGDEDEDEDVRDDDSDDFRRPIYLPIYLLIHPTVGAIQHYKTIGSIEHRPALELKPIHPSWELAKVTYFLLAQFVWLTKHDCDDEYVANYKLIVFVMLCFSFILGQYRSSIEFTTSHTSIDVT